MSLCTVCVACPFDVFVLRACDAAASDAAGDVLPYRLARSGLSVSLALLRSAGGFEFGEELSQRALASPRLDCPLATESPPAHSPPTDRE